MGTLCLAKQRLSSAGVTKVFLSPQNGVTVADKFIQPAGIMWKGGKKDMGQCSVERQGAGRGGSGKRSGLN